MREIRFRGKRLDNDEWVYGSLVRGVEVDDPNNVTWWIFEDTTAHQMHLVKYQHPVDPSTVGQYTGLKDKNGKEIYEGDVVQQRVEHWKLGDEDVSGYIRGVVAIYPSKGVCIKNTWLHPDGDEEPIELETPKRLYRRLCEVIGNIHDNPELLEEVIAKAREGKE